MKASKTLKAKYKNIERDKTNSDKEKHRKLSTPQCGNFLQRPNSTNKFLKLSRGEIPYLPVPGNGASIGLVFE